ncbi:[protein-PII] uridylyltransferase [Anaerobiospirillum succiniciproducens]|uniref:[protein-PII] uridylyltransferase n=1 Tax=Anaerobiospirillum succiniciproducens TaxID=13335 RepID=UPI000A05FA1E|nr:[protein-PII] uridylyltransferase [Anaerobiospirillum succiniciproducens]
MYTPISMPRKQTVANLVLEQPLKSDLDFTDVKQGREYLNALDEQLVSFFKQGFAVASLLEYRTFYIDQMLMQLFKHFKLDKAHDVTLIAVGGYGRAELFLRSDIDLLVASVEQPTEEIQENISSFISHLWDLKLDIGSSVRTIEQTLQNVNADLTICTNMLETRFLCGNIHVYNDLLTTIKNDSTWNTKRFFHAKVAEELDRHHAYKDTSYALEPDIKHNPGGIRDIHVMQWIANFHFQAKTPEDMLVLDFLSKEEYEELIESREVLYQVRYALHITRFKDDNRLSLDCQPSVAELLNYTGTSNEQVETMMRDLYRSLRRIRELNSMTLQLEVLRITGHLGDDETQFLNNDFVRRGPLIDVTAQDVFENDKSKMIEVFYLMYKHPEVVGLHVNCLRLLRKARRSLTNYLVEVPECRAIFKTILQTPQAAVIAFPLMHEHRVLSAYMPSWEKIEGLCQFDMFHMYTVDEHTIRVIKSIDAMNKSDDPAHALFKHVYAQLSNPEILVVAALMHDIAKGQGGHHAQLGAGESLYFCQLHRYTLYQTRLVSWLVYNHLLMSATAQRRDINDPQVVNEFTKRVQDEEHLNLLYCLTATDISATNDRAWNSWKDQVLKQLYFSTRQALRHGLEMPHDIKLHAGENQQLALKYMRDLNEQDIRTYWSYYKHSYFIYYTPFELAWHTRNILQFDGENKPLILFAQHDSMGTEILIHTKEMTKHFNFGYLAYILAKKKLNIQAAQFIRNKLNHSLCTVKFLSQKGGCIDNERLHSIRKALLDGIGEEPNIDQLNAQQNKNAKIFKLPTQVNYIEDHTNEATNLEITTLDQPGLLAKIGITFGRFELYVRSARITTTGERADDFFSVTDRQGRPLSERTKEKLANAICDVLDPKPLEEAKESSK